MDTPENPGAQTGEWPYRAYYDIVLLDDISDSFSSWALSNASNRCKWFISFIPHKSLEDNFILKDNSNGTFIYERKADITLENITPLTGTYRELKSNIPGNQAYLNRVDEAVYKTGVPVDRYWTFELLETIKDIIDLGTIKTIFDIGSRDCYQSLEFSTWFPEAAIYAFEANPTSIPLCLEVSSGYDNIKVIEKAVSNIVGETSFFEVPPGGNIGASSLLKNSEHPRSSEWSGRKITVPCITLDAFIEEIPEKTVDILWIDVQGAELHVLQGATKVLDTVKVIATEVGITDLYERGTLKSDLDCFLKLHGFVCIATYCHGTNTDLQHLKNDSGEIDAIYIKEGLLK